MSEIKNNRINSFLSYVDKYIINGEHFFWITSPCRLKCPFDIKPEQFLKVAEKHLKQRNYIDALSNIKRGIDSQMDMLIFNIGYLDIARKGKWSFPKKIDLLNDIGILAPRILNKINRCRNQLEHSFKQPTSEIVEDYLDIAMLFKGYTEKYLIDFTDFQTDGGDSDADWYSVNVQQSKIHIEFISQTRDRYKFYIPISDKNTYDYIIVLLIKSLDGFTG